MVVSGRWEAGNADGAVAPPGVIGSGDGGSGRATGASGEGGDAGNKRVHKRQRRRPGNSGERGAVGFEARRTRLTENHRIRRV